MTKMGLRQGASQLPNTAFISSKVEKVRQALVLAIDPGLFNELPRAWQENAL